MAWGREVEQATIEAREAAVQELVRVRQAQDISSIAFVAMAQAGQIDDVTISEYPQQFTAWRPSMSATVGQIMRYNANGKLYRVVQAHTTQADWTPDTTPALFTCISDPADPWPEWAQPVGAHDAYAKGDRVTHSGARWVSDVAANVWEPGVYGWTQQAQ